MKTTSKFKKGSILRNGTLEEYTATKKLTENVDYVRLPMNNLQLITKMTITVKTKKK